jgi:hypothetical protein
MTGDMILGYLVESHLKAAGIPIVADCLERYQSGGSKGETGETSRG